MRPSILCNRHVTCLVAIAAPVWEARDIPATVSRASPSRRTRAPAREPSATRPCTDAPTIPAVTAAPRGAWGVSRPGVGGYVGLTGPRTGRSPPEAVHVDYPLDVPALELILS